MLLNFLFYTFLTANKTLYIYIWFSYSYNNPDI